MTVSPLVNPAHRGELEAAPEDLDVDPLRPIDQIAEAYKSRMDYHRSPRLGH